MPRSLVCILALAVGPALLAPAAAEAQGGDRFRFSLYGGGFFSPNDVDFRVPAPDAPGGEVVTGVDFESAPVVGGDFAYRVGARWEVGVTFMNANPDVTAFVREVGDGAGDRLEEPAGDDRAITGTANVRRYFGFPGGLRPFATAGLGAILRGGDQSDQDVVGHFGGGALYPLGDTFSVRVAVQDFVSKFGRLNRRTFGEGEIVHEVYVTAGIAIFP